MNSTLYDVLGVPRSASLDEIRAAYRAAVKRTHPDAGGDAVEFMQVQAAWETLSDPSRRAAYDASLAAGTTDADMADSDAEPDWGADPGWGASTDFGAGSGYESSAENSRTRPTVDTEDGVADRYGFPASSTVPKPSPGLLVAGVLSLLLLGTLFFQLFTGGTFAVTVGLVLLGAVGFRIFSRGDSGRSKKILWTAGGLIIALGLIFMLGGKYWVGVLFVTVAILPLWTIERARKFRLDVATRAQFLKMLDAITHRDDVHVYIVEHAQMNGAQTRVSLLDLNGVPAGPKSLWGLWLPGMVVAVDGNRRVIRAATVRGMEAAASYRH